MTSIFLRSGGFLVDSSFFARRSNYDRFAALLIVSRGMFNCLAPRVSQLQSKDDEATSHIAFVASNADTYHLSREVILAVPEQRHEPCAANCLSKLTQVRQLTVRSRTFSEAFLANDLRSHLERLAATLEDLHLDFDTHGPRGSTAKLVANLITPLHNLRVLHLPRLVSVTCSAIAAGPGRRLRELCLDRLRCRESDLETLVAGCPEILHFELSDGDVSHGDDLVSLAALSQLRYIQSVTVPFEPLFCDDEYTELPLDAMQAVLSNWPCLTDLEFINGNALISFTDDMATAIATTVGPQLRALRLRTVQFTSGVIVSICNAASFPLLQELDLCAGLPGTEINCEGNTSVSLSPQLQKLSVHRVQITPRILTQLLDNKTKLEYLEVTMDDDRQSASGQVDGDAKTDWLSKLAQCPLRQLQLEMALTSVVQRPECTGQLAATLTEVDLNFDRYFNPQARDFMLGALCSRCVLIEKLSANCSPDWGEPIDASVAFAGLRNNERLRSLTVAFVLSTEPVIDELMSIKSTGVQQVWLQVHWNKLNMQQCVRLAKRFPQLRRVAKVDNKETAKELARRFPRISWQH